jgi:hypothetical protein
VSDRLDYALSREKPFEPISEDRYLVRGRAYLASVHNRGAGDRERASPSAWVTLTIECVACHGSWKHGVEWTTLRKIYVNVPERPSPATLHKRLDEVQRFVERAAAHICMPRGYTPIERVALRQVDKFAPRAQQLEAIMVAVADLAAEARNQERGEL